VERAYDTALCEEGDVMILGCHLSIAGGPRSLFFRASTLGVAAIQIFTANQRTWRVKTIEEEEAREFIEAWSESLVRAVISHDSYLINLGSTDTVKQERSKAALRGELARCDALGIDSVVVHPGSHDGRRDDEDDERRCLDRIGAAVGQLIEASDPSTVRVLLETMAGQGRGVGHRFEHLAHIMDRVGRPDRVGVCVDTAHVLAAGYEIRTEEGFASTVEELAETVGLESIGALHLNDSLKECGTRVDRHAEIGLGCMGMETFDRLLHDERFSHLPGILETPGGEGTYRRNLDILGEL
jgi:deoxyribonuclease IV